MAGINAIIQALLPCGALPNAARFWLCRKLDGQASHIQDLGNVLFCADADVEVNGVSIHIDDGKTE